MFILETSGREIDRGIQEKIWGNLNSIFGPKKLFGIGGLSSFDKAAIGFRGTNKEATYNVVTISGCIPDDSLDALYLKINVEHQEDVQNIQNQPIINIQPHHLHLDKFTTDPEEIAKLTEQVWSGITDQEKDRLAREFSVQFARAAQANLDDIPNAKAREVQHQEEFSKQFKEVTGKGLNPKYERRTNWSEWEKTQRGILSFAARIRDAMDAGTIVRTIELDNRATLKYSLNKA